MKTHLIGCWVALSFVICSISIHFIEQEYSNWAVGVPNDKFYGLETNIKSIPYPYYDADDGNIDRFPFGKHSIQYQISCGIESYILENQVIPASRLTISHRNSKEYNSHHIKAAGFNSNGIRNLFRTIGKSKIYKRLRDLEIIRNIKKWFQKIFRKGEFPPPHPIDKLTKTFEDLTCNEGISERILEYLENPDNKHTTVKKIRCLKQDEDKIRFMMWEDNNLKSLKIINVGNESINLSEYDINNMRKEDAIENGINYVYLIIPKKPRYVLDGKRPDLVSQKLACQNMIFSLPDDNKGTWEKVKEVLVKLFRKQSWDELLFKTELKKFHINNRDVKEIEEYIFVKSEIGNEDSKFIQKEVA